MEHQSTDQRSQKTFMWNTRLRSYPTQPNLQTLTQLNTSGPDSKLASISDQLCHETWMSCGQHFRRNGRKLTWISLIAWLRACQIMSRQSRQLKEGIQGIRFT